MQKKLTIFLILPVFSILLSGCGLFFDSDDFFSDNSTKGEKGKVEFNWDNGFSFTNVGVSAPMITQSEALMFIRGGANQNAEGFAVSSESPEIIDCKRDDSPSGVICAASSAGFAFIRVTSSSDGSLVDRVKIESADIARLELEKSSTILMEGGETKYHLKSFDSKKRELVGKGGVTFSTEPEENPNLDTWREGSVFLGSENRQYMKVASKGGLGTGKVKLLAASGVTAELIIQVVSPEIVDHIELKGSTDLTRDQSSSYEVVAYTAQNEKIASPVCSWILSAGDGSLRIMTEERDRVSVYADQAGSGNLTCNIGSKSKTLTIRVRSPN